jgi:type I restriction enzyme S subunit
VGWLGIKDARENHGGIINQTSQSISELGLQNSSARLLPIGTICLSRTASVGYVVKLGASMATSQDFINWVCSDGLDPDFLKYIFLAEGRDGLLRYGSGSVHQTIYYPEAKAFHVCIPSVDVQRKIVGMLDELSAEVNRLSGTYTQKLGKLSELRNAVMAAAFAGELGGTKEAA